MTHNFNVGNLNIIINFKKQYHYSYIHPKQMRTNALLDFHPNPINTFVWQLFHEIWLTR